MRLKIVGPPGTGKTTAVLQKVKEYAERSDIERICACTFTVSAKDEMKTRVELLLPRELHWKVKCSTIHSLAFDHVNAKKHFMVNSLYEFAKDQGERSLIINDRIPMNAKTPLEQAIAHYHIVRTQTVEHDTRVVPTLRGCVREV
jgi:superfamily I DNA/RNA helicase